MASCESSRFFARLSLLSKVGALAGTLEYDEVLSAVARLSIPELADWCMADAVEDGGDRRVEVAHRDPARAPLAAALRAAHASGRARRHPLAAEALRSGRPVLVPEYTEELLRTHAGHVELALARQLQVRSVLIVPVTLPSSLATMSFLMTAESGRRYEPEDVAIAEELVRRAAQVVENARVHQRLRETEARFRVALAHSRVTVFEQDLEGRYRWVYNPPLGYRPEDVLGKTNDEILPHEDALRLAELDRPVLQGGERVNREVGITSREGDAHHLLVSQEPLRDATGAVVGITGAATDITDQKRAQAQLQQALAFREQMMGILGHDLRNPVSAVRTLASLLLRRGDLAADARSCAAEIDRAAERMLEMIGTLLDFTRSRFVGEFPIAPVATDLHEVCRGIVREARASDPDRHVELALEGDGRGTWDPARLSQVVSNLVSNALQHGARHAPIRVNARGDADDVVLHVENDGPPIAQELMPVLFEPFCRGSALRDASRARGLGLGLFIVRQIVTAHGGTVEVESTPERGTRFTVRLPRRRASRAAGDAGRAWSEGVAAGA